MTGAKKVGKLAIGAGAIAGVVVLILCLPSHRGEEPGGSPASLSVDADEWDFGVVPPEHGVISHTFTLTNAGPSPVSISQTRLGCNCLAAKFPDVVAPHSTAPLKIDLELRNREGPFSTSAVFASSDPLIPTIDIRLKFYVQPRISLDPSTLQFFDVMRGDLLEKDVKVVTRLKPGQEAPVLPQIEPTLTGIAHEYLSTEVAKELSLGGLRLAVHRFRFSFNTALLPGEEGVRLQEAIRVKVPDSPDAGEAFSLEIHYATHPWLQGPSSIALRRDKSGQKVRLWSRDKRKFVITKIVSSFHEVESESPKDQTAREVQTITLLPGTSHAQSEGTTSTGTIEIWTSSSGKDEIPYRLRVLLLPEPQQ